MDFEALRERRLLIARRILAERLARRPAQPHGDVVGLQVGAALSEPGGRAAIQIPGGRSWRGGIRGSRH